MTPERWEQVSSILDQALRLGATQRSIYIEQISDNDRELGLEVESLIASHEKAGAEFLNTPVVRAVPGPENLNQQEVMLGRRLGAYQLVELIEAGGMGEVYRGFRADDQYHKQVALKLIRAGQDSGFVINRFKNERQILANLDHPNIARLLDGGTSEEGAPYFVMELIEGKSIDKYCQTCQLDIAGRLRLFLQVCSAVQYAHQQLIIHRDLKPSNILVTSEGTAKLLDFGIAKILGADAATKSIESTLTQFRALTPRYASPEQIKGEPISTASDVYSLGVLLYELLTSSSPYGITACTQHELAQAVCELEPEKPSAVVRRIHQSSSGLQSETDGSRNTGDADFKKLGRRLEGDVDNIVLMALRKEPQRRYGSVEQFAEDIRRHLEDLPVIAREDTTGYRVSKFVARHRAGVIATAAVVIVLIVALLVTVREAHIAGKQAEIARAQSARAERRFNDVRALANSLMFEIHDSIRDLPGSTPARKLLVDRALQYLDSLSAESGNDLALMREMASAYERVGDVQGDPYRPNLGDIAGAMKSYQKSLTVREILAKANATDQAAQSELAESYDKVAGALSVTGDAAQALGKYRQSLAIRESRLSAEPASDDARWEVADSHNSVGDVLVGQQDWTAALKEHQQALSGFEALGEAHPDTVRYRRMAAISRTKVAFVYERTGETELAVQNYQKAVAMLEPLVASDPDNALLRRNLAHASFSLGSVLVNSNDSSGLKELRHAAFIDESLAAADPADKRIDRDLALIYGCLGDAGRKLGDTKLALQYYVKAVSVAESRSASDPQNADARGMTADACKHLGELYRAMAKDHGRTASRERILWQNAQLYFQKSIDTVLGPKRQWPLSSRNLQNVQELQERLRECDTALGRRLVDSAEAKK